MFEGKQGIAKSKALSILAVNDESFSDIDVVAPPMKEQIELTEGTWINELGEIESVRRGKETRRSRPTCRVSATRRAWPTVASPRRDRVSACSPAPSTTNSI